VAADPPHLRGATRIRFAHDWLRGMGCTTQFTVAFSQTIMMSKMALMLSIWHLPINIHHGHFALHHPRWHLNCSGIKCSLTVVLEHVELQRPSLGNDSSTNWLQQSTLSISLQQTTASAHLPAHWSNVSLTDLLDSMMILTAWNTFHAFWHLLLGRPKERRNPHSCSEN